MANKINELETVRRAVASVALSVEKLGNDLHKTQARLLSLEAVAATLFAKTTGTTPQSAFELIRHQADSVSQNPEADERLATIQVLLTALQTQIPGKA